MDSTRRVGIIVATIVWMLASCGGGGGGSGTPVTIPPPANAAVGGIWEGALGSGQLIIGLVAETGEFHFIDEDGVQYFGTASTNVNSVGGAFTGYAMLGTTFVDGSTRGNGTITGTVNARSTFNANTTFTTSAGTSNQNTVSLTFNQLYNRDSSLGTIAGNFVNFDGTVVNINANGVAFAQDPATGCVINGTVSIIDANFNIYRVQFTYSNCQGSDAILNGTTFRGLATLDNTVTPEELIVGAQGATGNMGISVIFLMSRS